MAASRPKSKRVSATHPNSVRLAGVHEAAKLLRISKSSVYDRAGSDPDFPAPIAQLACGKIWDLAELEAYRKSYDRTLNWYRARGQGPT